MTRPLTVAVVGCGGISGAWFKPAVTIPGLKITGLVDINRDSAAKRRDEFNLKDAVIDTDLKAVLRHTKPDMVFNLTIPAAHMDVTLAALARGCHVFSEKPLADSMANAHRMVQAAAKARRIFAVMQNRRFDPRIRGLVKFLRSGAIGRVTTVNCDFYLGAHFGGFRDRMKHVLILDMAIHTFDAARLITGADPRTVYCHEWNPAASWYDHDASAMAVFEMTGGIVYNYRGSWCSEGLNTTWECDWRIIGEKGSVTWDGGDGFAAQAIVGKEGFKRPLKDLKVAVSTAPSVPQGGHAGVLKDFIRCVRTGRKPETIATDNIKSLAMVFGAIQSADSGRKVAIRA
jgi:predicted dehydrogenase